MEGAPVGSASLAVGAEAELEEELEEAPATGSADASPSQRLADEVADGAAFDSDATEAVVSSDDSNESSALHRRLDSRR